MSTTYTLFTEVLGADHWYCINPLIKKIDLTAVSSENELTLVPTFETNARHDFEKIYYLMLDDGYRIGRDGLSQDLLTEMEHRATELYNPVLAINYDRTKYVMYNPKSVVQAMQYKKFSVYWEETQTDESFMAYMQMNIPGLQDAISRLVDGECVPTYIGTFLNDMTSLKLKDDVLTLLVHMGYLSYDEETSTVSIPNYEVRQIYNGGNL